MLDFIITLLISCLMGMGIGGGGLYISYLTLYLGVPSEIARGCNLVFFALAGSSALCLHLRKRHVFFFQFLFLVLFGALGSIIFSHFGNILDPEIPKKVLGSVLILGGAVSLITTFLPSKK